MQNRFWKHMMKYTGVLVILSLIVLVACTNIDTTPKEVTGGDNAAGEDKPVVIRTDEIFDNNKYKDKLTIRYFHLTGDVRMGDSILVQTPEGKSMLIDAGVADSGKQIVEYLDKLGIDEIDIALVTHPHADHIGGFSTVARMKTFKASYMVNFQYTASGAYNNAMSAFRSKNVPVTYIERGDTFKLGNDVTIEVYSPGKGELPAGITSHEAPVINHFSSVAKLTYKNQTYLLSGDIYKQREEEIVEVFGNKLKSDVAHMPHHGTNTSSGVPYIDAVNPTIALASNNIFSVFDVMKRYDRKGSQVGITGLHGNLLVVGDGNKQLDLIKEKEWEGPPGLLINQK